MTQHRHLAVLFAALLLSACASSSGSRAAGKARFPYEADGRRVSVVPLATGPLPSLDTGRAVAAARQQVAAAKRTVPTYSDPDNSLRQAEQAAAVGNNPRAQSYARQAGGRADAALDAQRTRQAASELQALYNTTGLTDAQYASLRAAETALVRGDSSGALTRLLDLHKAVSKRTLRHTVQRGETLSSIAAREDVYGNSLLWPLIWQANRAMLPSPHKLRLGQKLVIRPSPTVEQVVAAIAEARKTPARVRVGRVTIAPSKLKQ